MGDGQVASNGLRLCTDSYKITEVVKLMNVLMIKYRIKCSINIMGGKPRIYISAKSISLLSSIVKPHMTKDMYYKLESGKRKLVNLCGEVGNIDYLNFKPITNIDNISYISKRTFSTKIHNKPILVDNSQFVLGSYLAGLFEGKGHI
jgi:hypothetical protein